MSYTVIIIIRFWMIILLSICIFSNKEVKRTTLLIFETILSIDHSIVEPSLANIWEYCITQVTNIRSMYPIYYYRNRFRHTQILTLASI